MSNFPIDIVRQQFTALAAPTVYLDNPAGTQVPKQVISSIAMALSEAASNLGGLFQASRKADDIYSRAHDAMAEFLGAESGKEIVIGQSMTTLTFQMSRSLGRHWRAGDEVIVTRMDHDGNIAPWIRLAEERGLIVRWLGFNRDTWRIEPDDLRPLLNERTRLLAVNYASNLTGSINDVAALIKLAKNAQALVYVDAVQFAPHGFVDVKQLGCDFLVCSAYKFFGPHVGVLWGRESILAELYAYAVRCAPQELPGRHETGTPQSELLAGLASAVDYLAWVGKQTGETGGRREQLASAFAAATAHEMPLAQRLIDGLREIRGVDIHGISNPNRLHQRVPTISLTHPAHSVRDLAQKLALAGINVWSGHNYALEVVRQLGIGEAEGVLRIGLAHYNTPFEVEKVLGALRGMIS